MQEHLARNNSVLQTCVHECGQHKHQLVQLEAQHSGGFERLGAQLQRCQQELEKLRLKGTNEEEQLVRLRSSLEERGEYITNLQIQLASADGNNGELRAMVSHRDGE